MKSFKPKSLNIALSIRKRNQMDKYAVGGEVKDIERDSIRKPGEDDFKEYYLKDMEERPMSDKAESEDMPHGMLGMDAKSIVEALRADRSQYPRPDDKYRDEYKDDKYAEGGPVLDPKKLQEAQDSMRKAFHYATGGEVSEQEEGLDHALNSDFEQDDSLSQDNNPMPMDLERSSNQIQAEDPDQQPKMKLEKIMAKLRAKHYGYPPKG